MLAELVQVVLDTVELAPDFAGGPDSYPSVEHVSSLCIGACMDLLLPGQEPGRSPAAASALRTALYHPWASGVGGSDCPMLQC